ncbi:MAG: acetyl/propionyl/methylcrotonyl-CoA carboxylase subunit alpha [Alphaproteobacteria bacterium]
MFRSVLIANRGEIACRIIRTARRMGLRTVAVYSDADARAQHVALAEEGRCIGPAPARDSYLAIERIIAAARESGAEAVHPGYGFLSENAGFADACLAAGLVFIGPPPAAIRAMGSKSAAKAIMEKAKVPVVPGYHGEAQDVATLAREADRVGYPLLIKATAGGGGRGMRVVNAAGGFGEALESARRESAAAFGDDRVLIERYLNRPRHIEMQVFADAHGRTIHLFERECSIQRRHQKVIEEAPAPGLPEATRRAMGEAAVAAAAAIGYVGAGTVEFIMDEDGRFYFMEMNTRLQVEHPVTEMITGEDLVEWQFRVAAGESLPPAADHLAIKGHAIEARIYSEDPGRGFLPSTGRLRHLRFPEPNAHVRIDSGVRAGDEISIHYDPMIAKLIAWGPDRSSAVRSLAGALGQCQVVGVANNLAFLSSVVGHADFQAGRIDTGFIPRHEQDLLRPAGPVPDRALAVACLYLLLDRERQAAEAARRSGDPHSPWHGTSGWRMNDVGRHVWRFHDGEVERSIAVTYGQGGWRLALPGGTVAVRGALSGGDVRAEIDGSTLSATVVRDGETLSIFIEGARHSLVIDDPLALAAGLDHGSGQLVAPMPGKILKVFVKAGDTVRRGAPLVMMEAMKMEHTIAAPADGTVSAVRYRAGEQVAEGEELLVLEAAGEKARS